MSLRISSIQNRPKQYAATYKGEQPTVADPEAAIHPDEQRENQQVPEQLVQERRMDYLDQLTGRHPVE